MPPRTKIEGASPAALELVSSRTTSPWTEFEGAPPAKLVVDGVSKWFRTKRATVHALDGVSLDVAEGEFVCLVGPSGCGKSTLLDIIAGLTKPDTGRVLADNQRVEGPGRHRLVMFQEPALFPWLTVFGNVMFGLKLLPELTNAERRRIAHYHLQLVGLEKFVHANVHELSGGMKQRVALARSLAPDPRVLLMDEPLAALDALTREQLYGDIQRIWATRRKTIVLVTHNVREAVCLGDRVILLSPHPGRIREEFPIPLPRPRDINSVELASYSSRVTSALKGYISADVSE
jgi:NitT/TauT family transport system ATP-binding protein